jgi:hypothetical protein
MFVSAHSWNQEASCCCIPGKSEVNSGVNVKPRYSNRKVVSGSGRTYTYFHKRVSSIARHDEVPAKSSHPIGGNAFFNIGVQNDRQHDPNQGYDVAKLGTIDESVDEKREAYGCKKHADSGHENVDEKGARKEDIAATDDLNESNLEVNVRGVEVRRDVKQLGAEGSIEVRYQKSELSFLNSR